jgi:hypothetical protein
LERDLVTSDVGCDLANAFFERVEQLRRERSDQRVVTLAHADALIAL